MSDTPYFDRENEPESPKSEDSAFKEAVCIDAMRVYDSCGESQCTR